MTGGMTGGAAHASVASSALFGTLSGAAISNVVSTGVMTIPVIKKAGFKPAFAGAVEAAASSGGQIMPPIMGAGAFVMASYTQISYLTIAAVALLVGARFSGSASRSTGTGSTMSHTLASSLCRAPVRALKRVVLPQLGLPARAMVMVFLLICRRCPLPPP